MNAGAKIGEKRLVPGPKGAELVKRRERCVGRALGAPVFFASRAKGARMWDVDGNEYLDWIGGICCVNIGHCNDRVVKAVKEQVEKFNHVFAPWHMSDSYVELAEKLIEITPGNFDKRVLLFNSGAEAVENAVKAARRYTGRYNILTFERAFHGRTLLTMGLTSQVRMYKYGFGPTDIGIIRAPYPYEYRCPYKLENSNYAAAYLKRVEEVDKLYASFDSIAAVIIEPVQGEGGYIAAPPEFLKGLRKICDDNGIVFIDDEVQAGLGRTGKMWAIEHSGVVPDVMTSAKSLGSGLVLSATLGKKEILDAVDPGGLGGTFGGNPASCVAGLQTIKTIQEDKLLDKANKQAKFARDRLAAMKGKYNLLGDVRGLGTMLGVELVKDRKTKEPAPEAAKEISNKCRERGLLIVTCGPLHNVFRLMWPLVIEDEELEKGFDIWEDAIREVDKPYSH